MSLRSNMRAATRQLAETGGETDNPPVRVAKMTRSQPRRRAPRTDAGDALRERFSRNLRKLRLRKG